MSSEIADLWITLRANAAGFTAPVRQAGEAATRTEAQVLGMGESTSAASRRAVGAFSALGVGAGLGVAAAATWFVHLGNAYQDSLNTLQAVSHASAAEMRQVSDAASKLGADLTLPSTSAADAAAAMTELAKGGLSVHEAMQAAKGTLQLAAAAQIEGAQAAAIQANTLNQFRLSAASAGHVADVLANTANAASGEITDMATALTYVGPVARAVGVSIDETATAIGLLAKNGILGDKAGTSLRAAIANLAGPTKRAATGMKELGIEAFDQQGKFLGLRALTDQLAAAKGRLSEKEFQSAAAHAFGKESLAAINALAAEGAGAFDAMGVAVSREGGAAEVAAAKTKGLGGSWQGFVSTVETLALKLYSELSPGFETVVRGATSLLGATEPLIGIVGDFASGVGAVTGFLNDHRGVLAAVATLYLARMVPAIATSAATMDGALGRAIVGTTLGLSRMAGSAQEAVAGLNGVRAAQAGATLGLSVLVGGLTSMEMHARQVHDELESGIAQGLRDLDGAAKATSFLELNNQLDNASAKLRQVFDEAQHTKGSFLGIKFDSSDIPAMIDAAKAMQRASEQAAVTRSNVFALSASLGVTEDAALRLAQAAGVDLTKGFDMVRLGILGYQSAQIEAASPTQRLSDAMKVLGDNAQSVDDKVKALKNSFDLLAGKTINSHEATYRYNQALDDLSAALDKSHGKLNLNVGAAGEAQAKFDDAATAAHNVAAALLDVGNEKAAEATLRKAIAQLTPLARHSKTAQETLDGLKQELAQMPGAAAGAATGMATAAPKISAAAKKAADQATAKLLAAVADAMYAGEDFSKGFAGGISKAAQAAINAATTMAGHAIHATRTKIEAESPSRATMRLGGYFGEGFAVGITGATDRVLAAASGLATRALAAMQSGTATGVSASEIAAAAVRANTTDVGRAESTRDSAVSGSLSAQHAAETARAKVIASRAADAAAQAAYANERKRYDALKASDKDRVDGLRNEARELDLAAGHATRARAQALRERAQELRQRASLLAQSNADAEAAEKRRVDAAHKAATAIGEARRKAEAEYAATVTAARDAAKAAQEAQVALADAVYASQVDAARTAADVIKGQLDEVLASARSFQDAFRSAVTSGSSLGDLFKGADGGVASTGDALGRLQDLVAKGRQFAADLSSLGGLGLSGPLLQQIMSAGVEQGDQIAQALLAAGTDTINDFNGAAADLGDLAKTGVTGLSASLFGDQATALQAQLATTVAGFDELTSVLTEATAAVSATFGGPITSAPAGAAGGGAGVTTTASGQVITLSPTIVIPPQDIQIPLTLDGERVGMATYRTIRRELIRDGLVGRTTT